ncbi:MAG: hypothetical protein ABL983_05165 [Nitrospira sp.]
MSAISDKYPQLGGLASFLGQPETEEIPAANGGLKQEFQHGTISWHPRTGAVEAHGAIRGSWIALAGKGGMFGYPVSGEMPAQDGLGRFDEQCTTGQVVTLSHASNRGLITKEVKPNVAPHRAHHSLCPAIEFSIRYGRGPG